MDENGVGSGISLVGRGNIRELSVFEVEVLRRGLQKLYSSNLRKPSETGDQALAEMQRLELKRATQLDYRLEKLLYDK